MITATHEEYQRALRRAEADFESALYACAGAVDTDGRRIALRVRHQTARGIRTLLVSLLKPLESQDAVAVHVGAMYGESEERLAVNVELLVRAWRAALHYEALKSREPK